MQDKIREILNRYKTEEWSKKEYEALEADITTLIQEKVKGFVKWNLKEDIKIQGSSLTLGASPEELLEARMERAERYLK